MINPDKELDPANFDLARRIEVFETQGGLEMVETLKRERPDLEAAYLKVAGGIAVFAGVGSPLTQAQGFGMAGPVALEELTRVERFYRERNAPVVLDLCPLADSSMRELTGARGYRGIESNSVLVLPMPPGRDSPKSSVKISVESIGLGDAALWAGIVARGFIDQGDLPEELVQVLTASVARPGVTCYLARIGNQPVAGGLLYVAGGVAGLYGTATLASHRGQSAQTALIGARLAEAVRQGCDIAISTTLPESASQRNLERTGFRLAYTKSVLIRDPA